MTRTKTAEPLVEIDSDNSFVPAGRQLGPDRTDGRDHHGLTSAEETAYQFAIDRLNRTPDITPASHISAEENDVMFHEVGFTSATPIAMKDSWVAQYRTLHPLPTSYSALPAGDPALYVSYVGPGTGELIVHDDLTKPYAEQALGVDANAEAPTPRLAPIPSPRFSGVASDAGWVPITGGQAGRIRFARDVDPNPIAPPAPTATPAREFNTLAEAMDTLEQDARLDQAPTQKTAPGVTPAPAVAQGTTSVLVPAAQVRHVPVALLIEAIELVEAHPEAVTRLASFVKNLFRHAA